MSDCDTIVSVRKRRRRAIDPSLGYYIASRLDSPKRNESHDATTVIISSPRHSVSKDLRLRTPACMVTVDDFLRIQKSTNDGPQKKYKNEERTIRRDYLHLRSRTLMRMTPPDSTSRSSQLSKKSPHGWRKRPFKKRIYEAAIATCVDPIRILAQPVDTPQSKPPLRLEPVNLSCARNATVTERKFRVANPLKTSCFSGSGGPNEPRFPMTHWQVYLPLNSAQGEGRILSETSSRLDGDEQAQSMIPLPLEFVPISRAESAYRVMFPPSFQRQTSSAEQLPLGENHEASPLSKRKQTVLF